MSRIVYATRIYYPLLYESAVSYCHARYKPRLRFIRSICSRNSFLTLHTARSKIWCSYRWPCIPEAASPKFAPDIHPVLPILLPFDNTLSHFIENLTVSYSSFGILSHISRTAARRAVINRLPFDSLRSLRMTGCFLNNPSNRNLKSGRRLTD